MAELAKSTVDSSYTTKYVIIKISVGIGICQVTIYAIEFYS